MAVALSVNIDVDDLDRAIAFYTAALGLTLRRRLFGDAAEMAGAPVPIFLLENPAGSTACAESRARRDYARHWTPVHLDFAVPDIGAAVGRAVAAGALPEGKIRTYGWGRLANLSDPFGNGFCLIEFIGRGYDDAIPVDPRR